MTDIIEWLRDPRTRWVQAELHEAAARSVGGNMMTNYCAAIDALLTKQNKIGPAKAGADRADIWRIMAKFSHELQELRKQAAEKFAALNGWRFTEQDFLVEALIRGSEFEQWSTLPRYPVFDHDVFFREITPPYRPVAIVGQPYSGTTVNKGIELAHSLGLELHTPPNSVASWWYPGWTRFFCLTRPNTEVRFLPDQLTFEKRTSYYGQDAR